MASELSLEKQVGCAGCLHRDTCTMREQYIHNDWIEACLQFEDGSKESVLSDPLFYSSN